MNKISDKSIGTSLIRRSHGSMVSTGRGAGVVSRMTSGVLDVMRRGDHLIGAERHHIGDIELDGPNYRQVLRWAKQLEWSEEQVLEGMLFHNGHENPTDRRTTIEGGAITTLVLDLEQFPITLFEWESGLQIKTLRIQTFGGEGSNLSMPAWQSNHALPSLRVLEFSCLDVERIDLPVAPNLISLYCCDTALTKLDLSTVPNLTELECRGNFDLAELGLSAVPKLTKLDCSYNKIASLDLSPVVSLVELDCSLNQLTDLDLSVAPNLTKLCCSGNYLTDLELSSVPNLAMLDCSINQLTDLDLSAVPKLTVLKCSSNQLTALDLSPVPHLCELHCANNGLTELDIRKLDDQKLGTVTDVRVIRS